MRGYAAGNYIYLASETSTGTAVVPANSSGLNIRKGPGTSYGIVGFIPQGSQCTVFNGRGSGSWYFVGYGGAVGYAAGMYIK